MIIEVSAFFILIFSILSLILALILTYYLTGSLKVPTISNFFMFKYVILVFIGATLLNVYTFEAELNLGLYNRRDLLFDTWLFAITGLFLIPFGMFLANISFRHNPQSTIKRLLNNNIEIDFFERKTLFYIIIILFIISLIVLFFYIQKMSTLPIIGVFEGLSSTKLAFLRSESNYGFDGKTYRYEIFTKLLPMLFLLVSFILKNKFKQWNILFYILFIYLVFVSIMQLHKAPLIQIILLLLFTHVFVNKKVSIIKTLLVLCISFLLLIVMYIFFMGKHDKSIFDLISSPLHRTFIGSITPLYWYQLFQEKFGYFYGTGMPNPAKIFPFEHRRIIIEVMQFADPRSFEKGIIGSMPVVFYGHSYLNFGIYISLFSMVAFGYMIRFIDIYILKKLVNKKTLLLTVLYIYFIFFFSKYANTSFDIVDVNFWIPVIFIFILSLFKNFNRGFKT